MERIIITVAIVCLTDCKLSVLLNSRTKVSPVASLIRSLVTSELLIINRRQRTPT
jgi:hypothetical protein